MQSTVFKAINPALERYEHSSEPGVQLELDAYITQWMPPNAGSDSACGVQCAKDIAVYIRSWQPQGQVPALACEAGGVNYGRRQMRLLTVREYENTLLDLLGYQVDAQASGVPADTFVEGFSNQVQTAVTQAYADAYASIATQAAQWSANNNFAGVTNCSSLSANQCANQFVDSFGLKAFRRPLTTAERNRYIALFDNRLTEGNVEEGIKLALQSVLSSPYFLMRSEMGTKVSDIIAQAGNGSLVPGDTNYSEEVNSSIPLYNNFGKTLNNYNFTGNDIFSITAKGIVADGARPSIGLRVDNQEQGIVLLSTDEENTYQFTVTGIQGSNKYIQITNDLVSDNKCNFQEKRPAGIVGHFSRQRKMHNELYTADRLRTIPDLQSKESRA